MNHFLKDFMFLRDNLKDRYSLVGKSSDITGERVELDLKQDRLFTYGLISDLSFATDLLNSRKLVSKLFFFFSLISVFFFIPPINSSQQFFLLKVFYFRHEVLARWQGHCVHGGSVLLHRFSDVGQRSGKQDCQRPHVP